MPKKLLTLTFIHQHPQILLGMKKRGFGEGRWNGFGGKVQANETVKEAALRELQEESGITVPEIEHLGVLDFEFKDDPEILEVHIFRAEKFDGEPTETDEMKPQWFHIDEIPFHLMWPDDIHWLPLFLERKKFRGRFLFQNFDIILEKEIKEM